MNNKTFRPFLIVFFLFFCCICNSAIAQQEADFNNSYYRHAVDLFEKEQYVDAEAQFRKAAETIPANDKVLQGSIASYRALCAISLVLPNTESIVEELEADYGNDPKMNEIYFALAKQFYHSADYNKAAHWFKKVDNRELAFENRLECMFLHGHTCFQLDEFEAAIPLFTGIIGLPNNKYKIPATYYYAHIEYKQENYVSALEGFQSIRSDSRFSIPAGYYILQIYVHQGRYKEAVDEGSELLNTATDDRYAEIAGVIVEACYRLNEYDEALKYFNLYKEKVAELTRNDLFVGASIYYHLKRYPEALSHFTGLTDVKDNLGQMALYYAGDAYLKTDNKPEALKYFDAARQLDFNPDITAEAWINYVKLSMELNDDSRPLREYRALYPGKDVQQLIIDGYTIDKQYDKALAEYGAVLTLTERNKADMQRLFFAQGINRMDSAQYEAAIQSFDQSLKYGNYDPNTKAISHYWRADALYHLEKYNEAQKEYNKFIQLPNAFKNSKEYRLAHYNIGYCFFNLKKYSDAATWFRKYVAIASEKEDKPFIGNAYNRIADCFYIERKYSQAIDNYNKAIANNAPRADYAMFQKGIAQGLNETRQDRKLETLAALSNQYPQSPVAPAAIFEIGRTYLRSNNFDQASKVFTVIIEQYKNSPHNQAALIELGLININTGNNKKAIEYYKQAILVNPHTGEAQNALVGLKNAYLEINDLEAYFAFSDSLAIGGDSDDEKEEARYNAAEKNYLSNDCDATIKALTSFLQLYPQSRYAVQANFYLGDCSYRANDFQMAKTCFEYVTAQPKNMFTEPALLGLAHTTQELTLYDEAAAAYDTLYAATHNEEYSLKALLMKANAEEKAGNSNTALDLFNELAKDHIKTAEGAEAAYTAITILRKQGRNEDAITAVFDLSESNTPQQYWVARGFIALGDIYVEQHNLEQARSTYESVLNGYHVKDDGIIESVQKRLDAIK